MKTFICISFCSLLSFQLSAQEPESDIEASTHYESVPDYPQSTTAGTLLGRIVDGFGFRYYWVSKDLRPKDLDYRPSSESRSSLETLSHINYMVMFMENILMCEVTAFPEPVLDKSYSNLRANTLERIQSISDKLQTMDEESISKLAIKIKAGPDKMEFPIWHLLQGPIGDMYYHLGQVVSFRRTTANPIDPTVQPFFGKRINP